MAVGADFEFGFVDDSLVNVHAAIPRRVGLDAVSWKVGPKDGNQGAGDGMAEGGADSSRATIWDPITY